MNRLFLVLIFQTFQVFQVFQVFSQQAISREASIQEVRSHLPLVVIYTYGQTILNEPKITVDIKVIDNGPGKTNGSSDPGNTFDGKAGIEIRGQSSQMFPKKSYGFELRNSVGDEVKVSMLGMPEESDWILYAPYSDKTMLRNAITFYLGGKMGRYQPRFRFCEVYLNGAYIGVYQLTERIKRDKDRVNITKMAASDITGDAVTGGYIVKVDKTQDLHYSEYFVNVPDIRYPNTRNYSWTWYYPKAEDLAQAQKLWFMDYIKSVENAINGYDYASPVLGYPKYMDVLSFIDFQIMNELSNNVDGYRYSTFFYKERDSRGGKLVAGPLWDFDISYGNVNYAPDRLSTTKWLYSNYGIGDFYCMHWWARLMQDPQYVKDIRHRWSMLRQGILHTDSIMATIDSQVLGLGDAVERNFEKWQILNAYVWPNSAVRYSYQAEVDFLKQWINDRLIWMDSQWLIPVTGTRDLAQSKVSVYPNPFNNLLNIDLLSSEKEISLEIFDSRGVKVYKQFHLQTVTAPLSLNLSHLENGMYIIRINNGKNGSYVTKVVKSR